VDIDRIEADKLLTTTRGVRRRLDFKRPVERSVIEDCVRIALQAPIGARDEKQHFVVVTDPEKRAKLADVYRGIALPYIAEREALAASLESGDPNADLILGNLGLAKWQAETMHEVPCMVLMAKEGRVEKSDTFTQASFYGSILPAAWSFMLALRARGLGACWTTLHIGNEREAAKILGMPEDVTQAVMLNVGYYTGDTFKAATRVPAKDQIHWDHWGAHA
jgi:nitroreductase